MGKKKFLKRGIEIGDAEAHAETPKRWQHSSHDDFASAVEASLSKQCRKGKELTPKMLTTARALLHTVNSTKHIPASNTLARQTLADLLEMRLSRLRQSTSLHFYMITIVDEGNLTGSWEPEITWLKMRKRAASVMELFKGSYVGFGEIQLTNNVNHIDGDTNKGQVICPHYHLIGWTAEPVNISELEKQMNPRFNTPKSGIVPVKIDVIPTEDDLARVVQYCFKSPFKCKNFYKNEEKGIQTQHESMQGNRNIRLQRLMELNSLIDIRKLLISGGDGVRIKSDAAALLKAILDFQSVGSVEPLTIKDVENFWRKMRKRSKHQWYKKPKVSF